MKEDLDILKYLPEINAIKDNDIREKTIKAWSILWQESHFNSLEEVPVLPSTNYPHIIHNRSVLQMALKSADVLEEMHNVKVDRDVLISAAALQDCSKLVEYEEKDGKLVLSEIGQNFQHSFFAAHIALDVGLPLDIVKAIISHTYENSYFPVDLVSRILFYADQIDMAALKLDRWKKTSFIYR